MNIKRLLSILLVACFCMLNQHAIAGELKKLSIGTLPAADSLLLYAAQEQGIFEKYYLEVEIVPFQSALELGAAMRAKSLDGHFGDIINVLMQNETGAPQQIIATTSYALENQRHFAIVASPKLKDISINNLQNKKVAIGGDTIVDFLLTQISLANNLDKNYFAKEDIRAIPVRLQLLMLGEVDAALLPEPLVTTMEAQGAKVIFDDTSLSEPLAVIALRNEIVKNEDVVIRFRKALTEAAAHINQQENHELYKNIMVKAGLLSEKVKNTYSLIQFDANRLPNYLPSKQEIEVYIDWMMEKNILKKEPKYTDIIWQEK